MSNVYRDAYREAGAGFGHTFPAPRDGQRSGLPLGLRFTVRLDYVYHSTHFRAIAARVAEWDGGSDHLAVVATLAWNEE
jgi:endonuclease/exonuclease/phosphatase (EEP) superfamily protein YafD